MYFVFCFCQKYFFYFALVQVINEFQGHSCIYENLDNFELVDHYGIVNIYQISIMSFMESAAHFIYSM